MESLDRLYDKLTEFCKEDYYPMHMPGHKRNAALCKMESPYEIDITEIEGFDNLHQPEGVLRTLSERISRLYGSKKAYPLVNGSTSGLLAAIMAATNRGDQVLLARNSHKAIYHGVILGGLIPEYIYPQKIKGISPFGGYLPEDIERALIKNDKIKLVIITSPTYEGVVSDIHAVADIVHRYGARLLVDEAHGAHFGFHEKLPKSAVSLDADLIIQSLHKTLPAFTQTAVLHSNCSDLNPRIEKYLAVHQSSSPSYILMAGMEQCISLLEENGRDLFEVYLHRLDRVYQSLGTLKHFSLLDRELTYGSGVYDLDPSKLTVLIKDGYMSGQELSELFYQKYHLVMEMASEGYILAMTSICDTEEGLLRFTKAMLEIDGDIEKEKQLNKAVTDRKKVQAPVEEQRQLQQEMTMLPCEAWEQPSEEIDFSFSAERCSASFVCLFPPGQPLLVPGERITEDLIEYILKMRQYGLKVTGLAGPEQDKIEVICETERNS